MRWSGRFAALLVIASVATTAAGCGFSYRSPHAIMTQRPSHASPSRLATLALPAPVDEAWVVVFNDSAETSSLSDAHGGSFGELPPGEAVVERMKPGNHRLVVHGPRAAVALSGELRSTCVYFARILDRAPSQLVIVPDRKMDASVWLESARIRSPRHAAEMVVQGSWSLENENLLYDHEAVCECPSG